MHGINSQDAQLQFESNDPRGLGTLGSWTLDSGSVATATGPWTSSISKVYWWIRALSMPAETVLVKTVRTGTLSKNSTLICAVIGSWEMSLNLLT